jgi:hypothetical protein
MTAMAHRNEDALPTDQRGTMPMSTTKLTRPKRTLRIGWCGIVAATLQLPAHTRADGVVDTIVRRFAESEFVFVRAQNNAPFLPLAWVSSTAYQESAFRRPDGAESNVSFEQVALAQGALVPIPIGKRDALVVGDWLSWTRFDLKNSPRDDLEVFSVSVPLGWIQQTTAEWQLAAFVAPLGHKTHEDSWYWETLGGVFARNVRSNRFSWVVGAYFDVAPLEDFYTPYLGAVYIVNERWTLNAVMPWPSVTYAPTTSTLFRLGVAPSGASWSIEPGERRPRVNLTTWNFGLTVEHHLARNIWLGFEVGVSGLRGLSIVGGDWEAPETKLDNTGFALLMLNLRPASARTRGR